MYRTLSNIKLVRELTREGVLFEMETEFNYPEIFKSRSCYKICDIFLYFIIVGAVDLSSCSEEDYDSDDSERDLR